MSFLLSFNSKAVAVLLASALLLPLGSSVSRNDLCFKQPLDQCSGTQAFQELGQTDANSDGRPFWFESQVSNANSDSDVTLQFKDSSSTGFSNVSTSRFLSSWGSSNRLFFGSSGFDDANEGNAFTVTIDGADNTIEVADIPSDLDSAAIRINGGNLQDTILGEIITVDNHYAQLNKLDYRGVNTTLNTGETKTVNVDGTDYSLYLGSITDNDDTIYYEVDGNPQDNADEGDIVSIGGGDFRVAEVIPTGSNDGQVTFTELDDGPKYAKFEFFNEVTSPEGYNEYRVLFNQDNAYSDSIFFSVDRNDNLPFDKYVEVNGSEVNSPKTTTGVTVNSNIQLNVSQNEGDPLNATLVNAANDNEVATISNNLSDQGAFRTIYSDLSNTVLASFTDTTRSDTFVFPTLSSDLLSSKGSTYSFYFEITERDASQDTRTTKVYTVQTDGSASNPAPQVNSIEGFNGSSWKPVENIGYGSLEKVRADVSDPNNNYLDVDLTYYNSYDSETHLTGLSGANTSIGYTNKTNGYYLWSNDAINSNLDSGSYELEINASDGNKFTTASRSWSYQFGTPSISISIPDSVNRFNVFDAELTVSCSEFECINENETIENYLDPKRVFS